MKTGQIFVLTLILSGMPSLAWASPDEDTSRFATRVQLQEAEYPGKNGSEPSAAYLKAFIKKRVNLAKKLHKERRLSDAILVLEGLSLHVPSIVEPRFDLAKLYYERVLIMKNQCQTISTSFTELAKAGKKEAAEAKLKELGKLQKVIISDAGKGAKELNKYLGERPKDTRPADMLWRFYLMTGQAPKALKTLDKMLKESPTMDETRKQRYQQTRRAILEQLKKPPAKKKRP